MLPYFRSADQGIEYISNVSRLASKNALAEFLSQKHESIMKQFVAEVGAVEHEFMVSAADWDLKGDIIFATSLGKNFYG